MYKKYKLTLPEQFFENYEISKPTECLANSSIYLIPRFDCFYQKNQNREYENSIIVGGTLSILKNNKVYPGGYSFSRNWATMGVYKQEKDCLILEKNIDIEKIDGNVLILGTGSHYGHFYVDLLDKVFNQDLSAYSAYVIDKKHEYLIDWLKFFGIKFDYKKIIELNINELLFVNNINCFSGTLIKPYWSPKLIEFVNKVKIPKKKAGKNLFITREKAQKRKIINLSQIKKYFQNDFDFVDTGDLNIEEQSSYFFNSKLIIGVVGSDLFNLLFCNANSNVICLAPIEYIRNQGDNLKMIISLCDLKNINLLLLACEHEKMMPPYDSNLFVNLDSLRLAVNHISRIK